jgi:transcriptional regulator with XRE-family HTH domain
VPIDKTALASFLRSRRTALQPEDVGLPRGARRRTDGLRREEVAGLAHMSTDYYARLERGQGPQPSAQMVGAITQGLRLSLVERDHVFRLAGHPPPARTGDSRHVGPGLLRILDRLQDTPAEILDELGETLRQTPPGVALTGDASVREGPERSLGYRWFVDPATRRRYAEEDHEFLSRLYASGLRELLALRGPGSRAAGYVDLLQERSAEFRRVWALEEVGLRPNEVKRFEHPEVGRLELQCQSLVDPDEGHRLLVYTAVPGSVSDERLRFLAVLGSQAVG